MFAVSPTMTPPCWPPDETRHDVVFQRFFASLAANAEADERLTAQCRDQMPMGEQAPSVSRKESASKAHSDSDGDLTEMRGADSIATHDTARHHLATPACAKAYQVLEKHKMRGGGCASGAIDGQSIARGQSVHD